ncbi:MAG: tRNA (adenosine(37)-N6)-threonylcarbamoyltransferase complex dimerization subunit type 1 TsaB [Desulfobulbus sp.]|nr:tRNA (adenosine(37)-N6)-threonylcarbamoyltransferase complex dimerization subunit type 1 TsaB [Desulfobulbus sp.]
MADVLILAIETATGCGSVAVTRGVGPAGKIVAEYTLQPDTTHSRHLLGLIRTIMGGTGTHWHQLTAVAVSQGPGSFTGLRIGMAAAQGIALAVALPLLPVPTLDSLAVQVPPADWPLCCLLDARKQQVYAAVYRSCEKGWKRVSPFLVTHPGELIRSFQEPTLVVGPGLLTYESIFCGHPLVRRMSTGLVAPRAAAVGLHAADLLVQGKIRPDEHVTPLYVRASEAEMNVLTTKTLTDHAR